MSAAVLIPVNESMALVDVADDPTALSEAIGCQYFTVAGIGIDGLRFVADDEGLIHRRPLNLRASYLADRLFVGDVLLIGVDLDGSTIDVPQAVIDQILAGAST